MREERERTGGKLGGGKTGLVETYNLICYLTVLRQKGTEVANLTHFGAPLRQAGGRKRGGNAKRVDRSDGKLIETVNFGSRRLQTIENT